MKDILIIKPEHRLSIKRHSHDTYEIIYYTDGKGVMHTSSGSLSFAAGNIIVVPPYTEHESSSQDGFGFYSLRGEFEGVLHFPEPILLRDNENNEALDCAGKEGGHIEVDKDVGNDVEDDGADDGAGDLTLAA